MKIIKLYCIYWVALFVEKLETFKCYRRTSGGHWYYIYELATDYEYWTTSRPDQKIALIVKEEHWK